LANIGDDDFVINGEDNEYMPLDHAAHEADEDPVEWSEDTDDDAVPDLVSIGGTDSDSEDIEGGLAGDFMNVIIDGADQQPLALPVFSQERANDIANVD
jgi:hypothetical protein